MHRGEGRLVFPSGGPAVHLCLFSADFEIMAPVEKKEMKEGKEYGLQQYGCGGKRYELFLFFQQEIGRASCRERV